MYHNNYLYKIVGLALAIVFLLAACGELMTPTSSPTTSPTDVTEVVEEPTQIVGEVAPEPTEAPTSEPEDVEPTLTQITIDGDPSDWVDREIVLDDPAGDSEDGFLDLTTGYAFVNQDALYFMVEIVDPFADFVQFDIFFQADDKVLQMGWGSEWEVIMLADVTSGYNQIGEATNSTFSLGVVLEGRVDLEEMGSPENLSLTEITVMVGECCDMPEWHAADVWMPGTTPVVNEIDPLQLTSGVSKYELANYFQLLDGYIAERIFTPALPNPQFIGVSESRIIYVGQSGLDAGISVVHPDTGEVERILDLQKGWSRPIVRGPGDSVLLQVGEELWLLQPDGSYEIWGTAWDAYYYLMTNDGRVFGSTFPEQDCIAEFFPDGTFEEIHCGFDEIYDIVIEPDGSFVISVWNTGDVSRVHPDGSIEILAENVSLKDVMDLAFSPDQGLFLTSVPLEPPFFEFQQLDPQRGMDHSLVECAMHPADFEFISDSEVLFVDPTWGMMTWADLSTGESNILIPNGGAATRSAIVGPDDALYVAADGCKGDPPGQIVRFDQNGNRSVYIDNLPNTLLDFALAPDGSAYIVDFVKWGLSDRFAYHAIPGEKEPNRIPGTKGIESITVLPNGNMLGWDFGVEKLIEFSPKGKIAEYSLLDQPPPTGGTSLSISPNDGSLYMLATTIIGEHESAFARRQLWHVDLETGGVDILFEKDWDGPLASGTVRVANDGSLWIMLFPEFAIYHVLPDGTATLFAQNLPIDAWIAAPNSQGGVYFTSPGGIFRIYQEP